MSFTDFATNFATGANRNESNNLNETHESTIKTSTVRVIGKFAPVPVTPKITLKDWLKYFFFNLKRKPAVRKKQKELESIRLAVLHYANTEICKVITLECSECRDIIYPLSDIKFPVYLSQLKAVCKNHGCLEHRAIFHKFYERHKEQFDESERISAWINNL